MKYYVYILESAKTGRLYIGQTQDVDLRLQKHNSGYVGSTKGFAPWRLLFSVAVGSRSEAIKLESKLKRRKKRDSILNYIEKMGNGAHTSGPEK